MRLSVSTTLSHSYAVLLSYSHCFTVPKEDLKDTSSDASMFLPITSQEWLETRSENSQTWSRQSSI